MLNDGPPINSANESWRPLKSWLLKSIHDAQKQLELVGAPESEHNATRGEIRAWRQLIAAVEPKALPEINAELDYLDD